MGYIVVFEEKPFGVTFGKNDYDKRNLFVTGNDETAAGYQESVINGSYIAKLETEVVEGLGAKKIFKIFKNKYADKCPLKITFRKPENVTTTGGNEEDDGTPEPPAPPNEEQGNDEDYEYYDEEETDIMNQVGYED